MRPQIPHKYFERAWNSIRRYFETPQPVTSATEMLRGSAIGMLACALIAAAMGFGDGVILGSGLFGIFAGALIGLLIWIAADETEEPPVVPPSQRRPPASEEEES